MPPLTLSDVRVNFRMFLVNRMFALPVVPRKVRPRLLRAVRLSVLSYSVGHGVRFAHRDIRLAPGVVVEDGVSFVGCGAVDVLSGARIGRGAVIDTRVRSDIDLWEGVVVEKNAVIPPRTRVDAGYPASERAPTRPASESG